MEVKYDICYIKCNHNNGRVMVSIVSENRDCCVVVCSMGVYSVCVAVIIDEYMFNRL